MPKTSQTNIALSCNAFGYNGGFERYTLDLVRGLHQIGIQPTVFARTFDRSLPEFAWIKPVQINIKMWPGKLRDQIFSAKLKSLKKYHNVDILIGCNRTAHSDIAMCGGTHLGFLQHSHKQANFWDKQQTRLESMHYAHAKFVVAHSQAMVKELQAYPSMPPIKVIYPPINQEKFTPIDDEARMQLRRALGFASEKTIFLFPSSSHIRKGLPLLANFFQKTTLPVELIILGKPSHIQSKNIRYLGFRNDIENLYRSVDFSILASQYEPFGLVGPESVLCGTPVVFSDNIACLEVMQEQAYIPFNREQADSLTIAIMRAIKLKEAGLARLNSNVDYLKYRPSIHEHIQSLMQLMTQH